MHKPVSPIEELEFWGHFLVFVFLWYGNVGGIPGGGILVPISMIFYRMDAKNAIAISNLSICTSSITRFVLMASKPHPLKNGTGS